MIEVLEKLGYHPEFDGKHNRYINAKYDSWVTLAIRPNVMRLTECFLIHILADCICKVS